jgi:hypothetical protein
LVTLLLLGILAVAVVVPNLRTTAFPRPRLVDSTNLRAIGQARIAAENNGPLPPEALTDVYALAAHLARARHITESKFWISSLDPLAEALGKSSVTILNPNDNGQIDPRFQGAPLAWAVALINVSRLPADTPIVWTRGLQSDGTWRKDHPYGDRYGGFILFAGGNVVAFKISIDGKLKAWGTGKPTSNIREALPPGTRIGEYVPSPNKSQTRMALS